MMFSPLKISSEKRLRMREVPDCLPEPDLS